MRVGATVELPDGRNDHTEPEEELWTEHCVHCTGVGPNQERGSRSQKAFRDGDILGRGKKMPQKGTANGFSVSLV